MFQFLAVAAFHAQRLAYVADCSEAVPFNLENPVFIRESFVRNLGKHRLVDAAAHFCSSCLRVSRRATMRLFASTSAGFLDVDFFAFDLLRYEFFNPFHVGVFKFGYVKVSGKVSDDFDCHV